MTTELENVNQSRVLVMLESKEVRSKRQSLSPFDQESIHRAYPIASIDFWPCYILFTSLSHEKFLAFNLAIQHLAIAIIPLLRRPCTVMT